MSHQDFVIPDTPSQVKKKHGKTPSVDFYNIERKKHVGAFGLFLLTFFNVSGGPWGWCLMFIKEAIN